MVIILKEASVVGIYTATPLLLFFFFFSNTASLKKPEKFVLSFCKGRWLSKNVLLNETQITQKSLQQRQTDKE